MDITFIPGDVTPEQVTVPPVEPVAAGDDAQSRRAKRNKRIGRSNLRSMRIALALALAGGNPCRFTDLRDANRPRWVITYPSFGV